MRRLSVVDEIFLRTHRGLGTPIALQGLWRTADPVEPAELARLHEALRTGPLARRVVRPRVPGARSRWQRNDRVYPVELHRAALSPETITSWADARGRDLDPERGPGWRLSAAPLHDGGTIVALTCSHVLADARGLITAVEYALQEPASGPGADPSAAAGGPSRELGAPPDSDWADAARIWATVAIGGIRAAAARLPRRASISSGDPRPDTGKPAGTRSPGDPGAVRAAGLPTPDTAAPDPLRHPRSVPAEPSGTALPAAATGGSGRAGRPGDRPSARADRPGAEPVSVPYGHRNAVSAQSGAAGPLPAGPRHGEMDEPTLILRCPAAEWERAATAYGGTANSLFIWSVANILWAAGFPAAEIAASLPVDTRDEPKIDNDLAVTEIAVTPQDGPADIRAKSRAAYERRMSSPGGLPEEFLHLVPDKVAHRLSRGAGERDILCSNIGTIPPALFALGSHECTGIATRALHPGLRSVNRPRTRLSGYLCRFRDDYILTLASLYPERIADAVALHRLAAATAARVDLPIRPW